MVATADHLVQKVNNTRPHSQMSTKNGAETTSYTDYTEKKANLASQVQEKKQKNIGCVCHLRSMMSTLVCFSSLEGTYLYYFSRIKKYTSHMYNMTET